MPHWVIASHKHDLCDTTAINLITKVNILKPNYFKHLNLATTLLTLILTNCRQVEHTIHINSIKQHNNRSKEDTIAAKTKI